MKRYVHGVFIYDCVSEQCGERRYMYLEQGLEERCNPQLKTPSGKPHKPTPFIIACPKCGGRMQHITSAWYDEFIEAKKGIDIFMNVKHSDCGKPRFNWGGE